MWQEWGFLYGPEGNQEISYAWGLGTMANNQTEIHALYCGICIFYSQQIKSEVVFGDSSLIINLIRKRSAVKDLTLSRMLLRILHLLSTFDTVYFDHVKREIYHRRLFGKLSY